MNCLEKLPAEVSLGERQRVMLARALFRDPPIIIADEPTANLDWENASKSMELFKSFTGKGSTVFVATHDTRITTFADKTFTLTGDEKKGITAL